MSPGLDPLSLKFAIEACSADGMLVDIGCGDGCATLAALQRGGRVVAVDPDMASIQHLLGCVPAEQRRRVKLRVAGLPQVDFKAAAFPAVHAARVLHFLDGPAIECSLRKFFRWLYPRGKLFVSVLTPAGAAWSPFQAEYRRRFAAGARWPGHIEDPAAYFQCGEDGSTNEPRMVHLLDQHVLGQELEAAGFRIQEAGCYALPWDPEQMCCAIVATCSG
jgi:SAM-dependent methyltransferase